MQTFYPKINKYAIAPQSFKNFAIVCFEYISSFVYYKSLSQFSPGGDTYR